MHSAGVGLAKFGKGDIAEYEERSLSFLDLCRESGKVFVESDDSVELEASNRGDSGEGDRIRFTRALGGMASSTRRNSKKKEAKLERRSTGV